MMLDAEAALVILSGGQDSTTCLFWAKTQFSGPIHALTFDYGQKHVIEIESAKTVAKMAGVVSHEILKIPDILHSTSPLLSDTELDRYIDAESMEKEVGSRVEKTFVPARNLLFFTIAANRAVELNCGNIVTGICEMDNANYPDCTSVFKDTFEVCANVSLGLRRELQVWAPLLFKTKAETVRFAYEMPECWKALAYTHTSYDGKYPPTDKNHSNLLRAQGFERAGLPDPLVLRAVSEGLMDYPQTSNYDELRKGA